MQAAVYELECLEQMCRTRADFLELLLKKDVPLLWYKNLRTDVTSITGDTVADIKILLCTEFLMSAEFLSTIPPSLVCLFRVCKPFDGSFPPVIETSQLPRKPDRLYTPLQTIDPPKPIEFQPVFTPKDAEAIRAKDIEGATAILRDAALAYDRTLEVLLCEILDQRRSNYLDDHLRLLQYLIDLWQIAMKSPFADMTCI